MWQIVGVNAQTHACCTLLITIVFEKKKNSTRGHRIGTTIKFYSYCRNSLPNPPPTVTPVSFISLMRISTVRVNCCLPLEQSTMTLSCLQSWSPARARFSRVPVTLMTSPKAFFLYENLKNRKVASDTLTRLSFFS